METFYKSVLSALSFFIIIVFLFSDDLKNEETPRPAEPPQMLSIKSVQFEQAPAIVNIGEEGYENKFNWQD